MMSALINQTNSLVSELYKPFLDLSEVKDSPIFLKRIGFEYNDLVSHHYDVSIQRLLPESLRHQLLSETGLTDYDVKRPQDLPEHLRTDHWTVLCNYLKNIEKLSVLDKTNVFRLLLTLGFHDYLISLEPQFDKKRIMQSDSYHATLWYAVETAKMFKFVDYGVSFNPKNLLWIGENTESTAANGFVGLRALTSLVVYFSKEIRDIDNSERCYKLIKEKLACTDFEGDVFKESVHKSRIFRATALFPFIKKDYSLMIDEMNACERLANDAIKFAATEQEKLMANENLLTTYESRSKESLALKNMDKAEGYILGKLNLEPSDSVSHLEYGDILCTLRIFNSALHLLLYMKVTIQ